MHEEGGKSTPNECSLRPVSAPPPLKMFSATCISEPSGRLRPLEPLERPVFPSFINARQLRNLTPRKPPFLEKLSINKLKPCLESLKDDDIFLLLEGVLATTKAAATRKSISNRFINQNGNLARASRFFVHFFAATRRLRRENA